MTDVCINGPHSTFVDRGEGLVPTDSRFESADALRDWLLAELAAVGKGWDARYPFIDATLELAPGTQARLHATFPPISRHGITVSVRRLASARADAARWSGPAFEALVECSRRGDAILICGSTGSGKTTLLNDLLAFAPERERIITLEDTAELSPASPHWVALVSRVANADGLGEVTLRTLLREALRMRPDRLLLGECRGDEVLDLLQALNTGHRGVMATLHASSTRDALRRIELLCLLASRGSIPREAIRDYVASGLEWIAFVKNRAIAELARIEGCEGDTVLLRPVVKLGRWHPDRRAAPNSSSG